MADSIQQGGRVHGRRHACGVPEYECTGSITQTHQATRKLHSTSAQAFKCMERYLLSQGYTKVGSREFAAPNDGPVRVLTKKVRYGMAFRPGKPTRWMFPLHATGGDVISM